MLWCSNVSLSDTQEELCSLSESYASLRVETGSWACGRREPLASCTSAADIRLVILVGGQMCVSCRKAWWVSCALVVRLRTWYSDMRSDSCRWWSLIHFGAQGRGGKARARACNGLRAQRTRRQSKNNSVYMLMCVYPNEREIGRMRRETTGDVLASARQTREIGSMYRQPRDRASDDTLRERGPRGWCANIVCGLSIVVMCDGLLACLICASIIARVIYITPSTL